MKKSLVITLLFAFFAITTLIVFRGSYWVTISEIKSSKDQAASIVPSQRITPTINFSNKNSPTIKIGNLEFHNEFGFPIKQEEPKNGSISFIEFPGNKKLVFKKIPRGVLSFWGTLNEDQKALLSETYGINFVEDDYKLLSTALTLTPDEFKWLSSDTPNEIKSKALLFEIKKALPNNDKPIYSFKTDNISGFQRGIPSQGDTLLHIFNRNNQQPISYEILCTGNFSQKQIDFLIQTIKFKTN